MALGEMALPLRFFKHLNTGQYRYYRSICRTENIALPLLFVMKANIMNVLKSPHARHWLTPAKGGSSDVRVKWNAES